MSDLQNISTIYKWLQPDSKNEKLKSIVFYLVELKPHKIALSFQISSAAL